MSASKVCELVQNTQINKEIFILQFVWNDPAPKAGQFFMIKPERCSVFLPRPISIFEYNPEQKIVKFLIIKNGRGTKEFYDLQPGERVSLTGPLGNAWADFLPDSGRAALVSGSIGVAPLAALVAERPDFTFHIYAGFKNGFIDKDVENAVLGSAKNAEKIVIAAEDGVNAHNGLILDYIHEPESYDVIFACGSSVMLKSVKEKFQSISVPCFLSAESRMACGVGACLGCAIRTVKGNARCCADGPIFSAGDIIFEQ